MGQSAPERAQPMLDPHELLARGAGAGAGRLDLLDLAPVVVVGRHYAAAFEQALQTFRARLVCRAPWRHFAGDPVGNFVTVGTVGPDRARRTSPGPPDRVEPVGNSPLLVEELAAALVIRDAVDRRARIADAGDDQRRRYLVSLARPARGAIVVKFRPLDDDPLGLAIAF